MGEPANYAIIEDSRYQLYYSHWGGDVLPRNMFWGPEHARRFIHEQDYQQPGAAPEPQKSVDAPRGRWANEDGWLDSQFARGAALLDFDQNLLLLFGGSSFEGVRRHVPLLRVYTELLGCVWSGWDVRWACKGIVNLADYVGYPRQRVIAEDIQGFPFWAYPDDADWDCQSPPPCSLRSPEDEAGRIDWSEVTTIGSIRFPDGSLRLYPLAGLCGGPGRYLIHGPVLLEEVRRHRGFDALPSDERFDDFPRGGGFHIDIASQTVDFWTAGDAADVPGRVFESWQGWLVRWHQDRFESQLALTGEFLRFPVPVRESLEDRLFEYLYDSTSCGGEAPPLAERTEILAHALAKVHPDRTWREELRRLALWLPDRKATEELN